jgi:hypothetical protein
MVDYDGEVSCCKNALLKVLGAGPQKLDWLDLGTRITEMHAAYEAQTDALVRQRNERDRIISDLLNQLAEARKK